MADLRVAHLVPAAFGPGGVVGGAERYVHELARAMAERVHTRLVTFGTEPRTACEGHLEIQVLKRGWNVRGEATNPFSLRLFAALRDATVVHCHQQHVLASSAAALYCRTTGRKAFVSDLGGGGWDISTYVSTDSWYHGHLHISEYSREVFGHVTNPRAHVILGGVDTVEFSPVEERSGDYVLYVGRILPHKGIDYLIDALADEMRLWVIGPPDDPEFLRRLKKKAAGKDVTFMHDADDASLIAAYRNALCIVLPSVYKTSDGRWTDVPELLGQTLLEGMACGIPALCTDVASLPEVVEDGVSGFVVPPNDPGAIREKLHWLHSHRNEAERMGEAARQRVVGRFTWPAVVDRCLQVYRDAAGAH